MADEPLDRRAFFQRSLRTLLDTVAESVKASRHDAPGAPPPLRRLRPPGAVAEPDFLRLCTRCDDCIAACPAACIVRVPAGQPDAGTPVIVPDSRACVMCAELSCTHSCAVEALLPLSHPAAVRIGVAFLDETACYAYNGTFCDTCVTICPTEPKAILLNQGQRPVVDAGPCTGCGLCEERCPTSPRAIRIEVVDRLVTRRG
ncbi:MAG: 4Fe-4S binding protein [Planctomycetes bacterium]|nr:4Fe-4S binding protein [Planctomycetota bacterium]